MYSTCLFCNGALGKNEAIEHFPVGRRLAFDAAKGRLWVLCVKCQRWNLSPLEERWEAIEECERAFGATRLRVSTGQIGLARLKDGLELVRIGEAQRPEMAAWRYGDQFGHRRRRRNIQVAAGAVIGLSLTTLGVVLLLGNKVYQYRTFVHVPVPEGGTRAVRLEKAAGARLGLYDGEAVLRVAATPVGALGGYLGADPMIELTGMDAVRAAGILLPRFNMGGGSAKEITHAVEVIEETPDALALFRRGASIMQARTSRRPFGLADGTLLSTYNNTLRLALEMAAHEDSERRALEGELHVLEAAWKQADEIASIADDLLLPDSVSSDLARLKLNSEER